MFLPLNNFLFVYYFTKQNNILIEFHSNYYFVKDQSIGCHFYTENVKMRFTYLLALMASTPSKPVAYVDKLTIVDDWHDVLAIHHNVLSLI